MMRTYSRKRPSHQQLENVQELCRLCLERPCEAVPIYECNNEYSSLALRIMVCVGLEMTKDDGLPNQVCMECHNELERYYAFRKKCENSYQKLKSHMIAVKLEKVQNESVEKQENYEQEYTNLTETLVFTINMDGTMQLQDSNERCIAVDNEGSLITFKGNVIGASHMGEKTNIQKEQLHEQSRINEIIVDNSIAQSSDSVNPIELALVQHNEKIEDFVFYGTTTADAFISSMLNTLEIVTVKEDGTVALTPSTSSNIELVTGDGAQILFELTEEDEKSEEASISLVDSPRLPQETKIENASAGTDGDQNIPLVWENSEMAEIAILPMGLPSPAKVSEGSSVEKDAQQDNARFNTTSNKKAKDMRLSYRPNSRVVCGMCGKSFVTKTVLTRHQAAVHARARPFHCAHCNKRFAQKEVWARHLLVHQEKRPFQCQSCPKSFTQRHSLTTHERIHAPPATRPLTLYQCSQCPKVFLHSSGLSRHMALHAGRVWVCDECGRPFTDSSALRRHERSSNRCTPKKTPKTNAQIAPSDTG